MVRDAIVDLVAFLTFNRVRGQRPCRSLRWWWTPWTKRFSHSGWVYLDYRWVCRFWNGDEP